MTRQQDTRQRDIPYEDADAALAERRNSLNLALQRVECDCHMAVLVQWIFNTEQRTGEPLQKTYRELAQRPHGLCCSPAKARATVGLAKQKGLIRVDEQRYKSGGQEANAYTIYWDGISTILRGRRYSAEQRTAPKASPDGSGQVIEDSCGQESSSYSSAADGSAVEDQDRGDRGESCDDPNALAVASSPPGPGALRAHPSAFIEQGGAMGAHPSAPRKQPYIGNTLSLPSLIPLSSQRTGSGPAPTPKVREDKVRGELIQEIPELAAAVLREVRPLPPEKTLYGAIAALDKSHFQGQLAAIDKLSGAVAKTIHLHCPEAARELRAITFACNRAWRMLEEAEKTIPAAAKPTKRKGKP